MQFPKMETKFDCGPTALYFAIKNLNPKFEYSYEEFKKKWDWQDYRDQRDNLQDTPYHAFNVLTKLNIPWQIRTCGDILNRRCSNDKTIILLHSLDNPLLQQHWVVLQSILGNNVVVYFLDGGLKYFSFDTFSKLYSKGTPACAYEIGIGKIGLTKFQKLAVSILGRFI